MFSGMWRDLWHAARSLAGARAFTLVCVISLGVGMVPVIAVPYVSRITRTAPPGIQTEGLVELDTMARGARPASDAWSYPDFVDLRASISGMSISAWINGTSKMSIQAAGPAETKSVSTMFVSANYFDTVGARLSRGTGFSKALDDPANAEAAVILGYAFWQDLLGADSAIVGKTLTLDGIPHLVVGIASERFDGHLFLHGRDIFVPIEQHPRLRDRNPANTIRSDRAKDWLYVVGRLAPGVSLAQANASVAGVTARLAKEYPATNELKAGIVAPYHPSGNLHRTQFLLIEGIALTLTGTVLLVVCLNISGMMQVRSAMRERELSIRQAIGASRARLIQYLLAEAIILAGLGSVLASLVLFNTRPILAWWAGFALPDQLQKALTPDLSLVAICVGLCLVTSVVFGLLPAARFSRPVIISSLKDDAGVGGFRAGRAHRLTAALQVAIAVPLIVMSGISLDRLRATATMDLGFDADLLYAAPLKLEGAANEQARFRIHTAQDALATTAGVTSATVADGLPLDFSDRTAQVSVHVPEDVAPKFVSAHVTRVGDGYLKTMGITLLLGRGFTADDGAGAEMVTVLSKPLAERLFPNAPIADALGKRLTLGVDKKTQQTLTVVGITGDFPTSQMSAERSQLLLPLAQHPVPNVFLVARSAPGESPAKMSAALENAIGALGPNIDRTLTTGDGVPYARMITGVWLRQHSMRDFLVQSAVAGTTGGVILTLAALGIYGVVGLMVAARTREIAVRVALGASRRRVVGMILFDVVKLAAPGVAVGLVITAALVRLNGDNMGIALSNVEFLAYVAGAAAALLVAVVSSIGPAHRAASIQPMIAMRSL